jgi:hypothetical protein
MLATGMFMALLSQRIIDLSGSASKVGYLASAFWGISCPPLLACSTSLPGARRASSWGGSSGAPEKPWSGSVRLPCSPFPTLPPPSLLSPRSDLLFNAPHEKRKGPLAPQKPLMMKQVCSPCDQPHLPLTAHSTRSIIHRFPRQQRGPFRGPGKCRLSSLPQWLTRASAKGM